MTKPDLEPELGRLHQILLDRPGGLREYDLLEILRGEMPLRGLDELGLFRVHFLLFHHLYRLRTFLEERRRGTLEIHCLRICLMPFAGSPPNPDGLPQAGDPVAEYYLDAENLTRTTQEDVRELLEWFWRRYRVFGRKDDALARLGLSTTASPFEVRRRYRELAWKHHPDRGGDPDSFREVASAMEVLRLLLE